MSVTNKLLKLIPDNLWVSRGTLFEAIRGDGFIDGNPISDITIDKNNIVSSRFNNANIGVVTVPQFSSGMSTKTFSIGGQFMPVVDDVTLLGTSGGEGLAYEGQTLKFTTIQGGTEYSAEHSIPNIGNRLIVGVHEESANYLYVDGQVVSFVTIAEQDRDSDFLNVSGELQIGLGPGQVLCDNIFVVNGFVDASLLLEAAQENIITSSPGSGIGPGGGGSFVFGSSSTPDQFDALIGKGFAHVFMNGTTVESLDSGPDVITPYLDAGGLTIPGQAFFTMTIGEGQGVPIVLSGSQVSWEALGAVTVEASVDGGSTFSQCQNGGQIPGAIAGTNMDNKDVLFRISFGGGAARLKQYIYNIRAYAFTDQSVSSYSGFSEAEVSGGLFLPDGLTSTIDYSGRWAGGGQVIIESPDDQYVAMDMLLRINSSSGIQRILQIGDLSAPLYLGINNGALVFQGISSLMINGTGYASGAYSVYDGQVIHAAIAFPHKVGDIYLFSDHNGQNDFLGEMKYLNIHNSLGPGGAGGFYLERMHEKTLVCEEDVASVVIDQENSQSILFGGAPASVVFL